MTRWVYNDYMTTTHTTPSGLLLDVLLDAEEALDMAKAALDKAKASHEEALAAYRAGLY